METIKNLIGLGPAQQEGQEPMSGVTGSGVAGEPYDGGNVEGVYSFVTLNVGETNADKL
jgi:hypothetical protein